MNKVHTYNGTFLLFSIMTLLTATVSCKKVLKKQTSISGHAINMTDNTGLAGYEVHLVEVETPTAPTTPLSSKLISSTTTDENGHFNFDEHLRRRSRFEYFVRFDNNGELFASEATPYGDKGRVSSEVVLEKGELNEIRLELVPLTDLKISATNNSGIDGLEFHCIISNQDLTTTPYYRNLDDGESNENEQLNNFASGNAKVQWIVKNDSINYTTTETRNFPHNEQVTLAFTYE